MHKKKLMGSPFTALLGNQSRQLFCKERLGHHVIGSAPSPLIPDSQSWTQY